MLTKFPFYCPGFLNCGAKSSVSTAESTKEPIEVPTAELSVFEFDENVCFNFVGNFPISFIVIFFFFQISS